MKKCRLLGAKQKSISFPVQNPHRWHVINIKTSAKPKKEAYLNLALNLVPHNQDYDGLIHLNTTAEPK
jgi:hypothetical protein